MIYELAHRAWTLMSVLELTMVGICEQRKWIRWEGDKHEGRFRITDREAFLQDWQRIGGTSRTSDLLLRHLRYYFQLQTLRKARGIQCYQYAVHALTYMLRKGYWKVSRESDREDGSITFSIVLHANLFCVSIQLIINLFPQPKEP